MGDQGVVLQTHHAGKALAPGKPGLLQKRLAVNPVVGGEHQVAFLGVRQEEFGSLHAQRMPQAT